MRSYIYRYENFAIKETCDGDYVVVNVNSSYDKHSHVKSVKIGKIICKLASKKKLPRSKDIYFINSLIRISSNREYIRRLENVKNVIENEEKKK